MSFTKGFWVTIIILTLNRLQDTQRTPSAGSRAERGDKPPPADASPITFLSSMSLSFRPRQPDQTQQENARVFLESWIQKRFLKLPQSSRQPLNAESGEMRARGSAERWLRHFHSSRPQPPPAPTITAQSRAPKEAEIENTFSLKHSLNFMNSITPDFLSISWSEYCRSREKGDGAGHR